MVSLSSISQHDLALWYAAVQAGPIWVEINEPMNRWHGTIGLVDYRAELLAYRRKPARRATSSGISTEYDTWQHFSYQKVPMVADKKKLKFTHAAQACEWHPTYTGPGVYAYTSDPAATLPAPRDMMGVEITTNSFVVTGTGQGELQLAKVLELFQQKYGSGYRMRARVDIILNHYMSSKGEIGGLGQYEATVGVDNILVLTDDLLEKVMIKRLAT